MSLAPSPEFLGAQSALPRIDVGKPRKSADVLEDWIRKNPDHSEEPVARIGIARLAFIGGKHDEARMDADIVLQDFSTHTGAASEAHGILGLLSATSDQGFQTAQGEFEAALKINPNQTDAKLFTQTPFSKLESRTKELDLKSRKVGLTAQEKIELYLTGRAIAYQRELGQVPDEPGKLKELVQKAGIVAGAGTVIATPHVITAAGGGIKEQLLAAAAEATVAGVATAKATGLFKRREQQPVSATTTTTESSPQEQVATEAPATKSSPAGGTLDDELEKARAALLEQATRNRLDQAKTSVAKGTAAVGAPGETLTATTEPKPDLPGYTQLKDKWMGFGPAYLINEATKQKRDLSSAENRIHDALQDWKGPKHEKTQIIDSFVHQLTEKPSQIFLDNFGVSHLGIAYNGHEPRVVLRYQTPQNTTEERRFSIKEFGRIVDASERARLEKIAKTPPSVPPARPHRPDAAVGQTNFFNPKAEITTKTNSGEQRSAQKEKLDQIVNDTTRIQVDDIYSSTIVTREGQTFRDATGDPSQFDIVDITNAPEDQSRAETISRELHKRANLNYPSNIPIVQPGNSEGNYITQAITVTRTGDPIAVQIVCDTEAARDNLVDLLKSNNEQVNNNILERFLSEVRKAPEATSVQQFGDFFFISDLDYLTQREADLKEQENYAEANDAQRALTLRQYLEDIQPAGITKPRLMVGLAQLNEIVRRIDNTPYERFRPQLEELLQQAKTKRLEKTDELPRRDKNPTQRAIPSNGNSDEENGVGLHKPDLRVTDFSAAVKGRETAEKKALETKTETEPEKVIGKAIRENHWYIHEGKPYKLNLIHKDQSTVEFFSVTEPDSPTPRQISLSEVGRERNWVPVYDPDSQKMSYAFLRLIQQDPLITDGNSTIEAINTFINTIPEGLEGKIAGYEVDQYELANQALRMITALKTTEAEHLSPAVLESKAVKNFMQNFGADEKEVAVIYKVAKESRPLTPGSIVTDETFFVELAPSLSVLYKEISPFVSFAQPGVVQGGQLPKRTPAPVLEAAPAPLTPEKPKPLSMTEIREKLRAAQDNTTIETFDVSPQSLLSLFAAPTTLFSRNNVRTEQLRLSVAGDRLTLTGNLLLPSQDDEIELFEPYSLSLNALGKLQGGDPVLRSLSRQPISKQIYESVQEVPTSLMQLFNESLPTGWKAGDGDIEIKDNQLFITVHKEALADEDTEESSEGIELTDFLTNDESPVPPHKRGKVKSRINRFIQNATTQLRLPEKTASIYLIAYTIWKNTDPDLTIPEPEVTEFFPYDSLLSDLDLNVKTTVYAFIKDNFDLTDMPMEKKKELIKEALSLFTMIDDLFEQNTIGDQVLDHIKRQPQETGKALEITDTALIKQLDGTIPRQSPSRNNIVDMANPANVHISYGRMIIHPDLGLLAITIATSEDRTRTLLPIGLTVHKKDQPDVRFECTTLSDRITGATHSKDPSTEDIIILTHGDQTETFTPYDFIRAYREGKWISDGNFGEEPTPTTP